MRRSHRLRGRLGAFTKNARELPFGPELASVGHPEGRSEAEDGAAVDASDVRRLFRAGSGSGRKSVEHLVAPLATILEHHVIAFVI